LQNEPVQTHQHQYLCTPLSYQLYCAVNLIDDFEEFEWMDEWLDEWINKWMNGWMDKCMTE
jgi:hypothetical protein